MGYSVVIIQTKLIVTPVDLPDYSVSFSATISTLISVVFPPFISSKLSKSSSLKGRNVNFFKNQKWGLYKKF